MSLVAALILAASASSQTLPAPAPAARRGMRATATVSVTIISAARVRLSDATRQVQEAGGSQAIIVSQRRESAGRVLVEFD